MKANAELTHIAETRVALSTVQAFLDLLDDPGLLQKGDHFLVEENGRSATLIVSTRRFTFRQGQPVLVILFDWPGR